jgi:mono/diheme cytochrome c family protein
MNGSHNSRKRRAPSSIFHPRYAMTLVVFVPMSLALGGCTRDWKFQPVDMWNGSRLKPYEPVAHDQAAPDNNWVAARALPAGTVARGQLRIDEALYNGTQNGRLVTSLPTALRLGSDGKPVSLREIAERGRERYDVFCLPCHGVAGHGDGMIVKRGFAPPPSYHIPRLREAPVGHFYDVITNGYGTMYSYASRVPVRDRWAIAQYIRVLQRSQNARAEDVPAEERAKGLKTQEQLMEKAIAGTFGELPAKSVSKGTAGGVTGGTGQTMPGEVGPAVTTKKPSVAAPGAPNDSPGQTAD